MWPSIKPEVKGPPKMKVALFAGCAQDFVYPRHLVAALKVFKSANIELKFPMDQTCCGLPLSMLGETDAAKKTAMQNIKAFADGCDAIVTLCASCASHLKHGYRKLLGEDAAAFSEKIIDFSSFIHDKLGLDSLKLDRTGAKTAYHASCHLCKGLGVKDAPREILKAATDYAPSPEEETCCGFGGTFSAKFPEISAELMRKKLANISSSGARRIALDCPGCAMQIAGGADRLKMNMQVCHISEILAEAVGDTSM
jgi:Fe-S oxidoreductase